uniref:Astrotactin-2 n=1 Tax=Pavo cristatus TaxID=9049 RepID=A0A8C9EHA5_PAVCR
MAAPPRRRSASPAPLPPVPPALLVLAVLLGGGPGAAAVAAAAASREPPGPCRVKTVTVSTLPVLRENDISWSGAPPPAAADSRLLLFVRSELPGRVAVQDDLDNTELPFFTLEMSGTVTDISLVHWKQQWLENGTLYFHVSMSSAEQLSRATPPSLQEPSEIVEEQMHILHISVMVTFPLMTHKQQLEFGSVMESVLERRGWIWGCFEVPSETIILCFSGLFFSVTAGGIGFGRAKGNSGSEADDETQLTFYTEQYRSRRRSKGSMKSPVNKTALTLIAVSSCILAMVCGSQLSCPLTVKVTLHVPEHFIADGSSFVVSEGSYLDISDWLNPAKLSLYYQINATSPWVRDLCGQRTTDACEQLCDQETGECSCHEGYAPDPMHRHLCVRTDWGHSEGPWPYTTLERGYDLVTGEQAPEKILRSTYSLGQGLWLPVSKSFVVPPVELSINPLASCKTDVLVTEDPADVREEAMLSTYFETINDLLSSFGPVRDCSRNNGGCTRNFKCVSDRQVDSTGCVCPEDLRPMKDGTGCYDYSKGIDCSDGFNGGCEQLCLQQTLPLPHDPSSSTIFMFCGCVEEYKLAPDGKSCLMLSDICEGPKCLKSDAKFNDTLFGEMLHGYNNRSQHVNQGQVFQMTFRENNFIKDFPQLADGLLVIPLPVEEQCRGVLSEPLPDLQLLTGDIKYDEAMGYPMVQHWRVRSNLYRVKLSSITLSSGFANILKILSKDSSREELLSFIQQFGSHYIAEALYGSEFSCTIHFPSKKVQQQLWLQYQKETTELGNKKELKSMPFITYLSGLLTAQMLSDDHLISGVEIHCEEKGRCPSTCHLCRRPGKEQLSPTPVLLEINRVVPLYALIQDNDTREVSDRCEPSSHLLFSLPSLVSVGQDRLLSFNKALLRVHLKCSVQFCAPCYKKDIEVLGHVPRS